MLFAKRLAGFRPLRRKPFRDMDMEDRIRASYLHACLKYVQRDFMTNTTMRTRFGIEERNSSMVSRIMRDKARLIRCHRGCSISRRWQAISFAHGATQVPENLLRELVVETGALFFAGKPDDGTH